MADTLTQDSLIPFLHASDATGEKLQNENIQNVLLLGTKFSMFEDFLKIKLMKYGVSVQVPTREEQENIDRIIFSELVLGKTSTESTSYVQTLTQKHHKKSPFQGIVLGCTELSMVLNPKNTPYPLFDTAQIHAQYLANFVLSDRAACHKQNN